VEVTRIDAKKYQSVFEGKIHATNKANQAKMPTEFDMYMKAKEVFTKKKCGS